MKVHTFKRYKIRICFHLLVCETVISSERGAHRRASICLLNKQPKWGIHWKLKFKCRKQIYGLTFYENSWQNHNLFSSQMRSRKVSPLTGCTGPTRPRRRFTMTTALTWSRWRHRILINIYKMRMNYGVSNETIFLFQHFGANNTIKSKSMAKKPFWINAISFD